MQILLIEHEGVEGLYPFSITHCSWELRCGALTIIERWEKSVPDCHVTIASHRDLHIQNFVERHRQTAPFISQPTLVITGHLLLSPSVMRQVVDGCSNSKKPIAFFCAGQPVGAYLPEAVSSASEASEFLEQLDVESVRTVDLHGHLITRLWHALDHLNEAIEWDSTLLDNAEYSASDIHQTCVVNESRGPVLISPEVRIEPYVVINGPAFIGRNTLVKAHASISESVIGPVCKVAGEIEHSVIQGYSNKQHDGFLGHSYLGEWVNLGAGTITSDLKNTYGHIRVQLPWGEEDTQRIMVGLLMGDHSKSAIGTMFSTGTVCGISCNVVSTALTHKLIRSFSWIDNSGITKYQMKKALEVARTVMSRRDVELPKSTVELFELICETDLR